LFWSPQNVAKVWSRGLEQRLNYQLAINNIQLAISTGYDWIRSTNQQINREAAIGKQLIYVPEHQAFGNVSLTWRGVHIGYQHQYTGEVFTRSDNSQSLPAYQLGFLDLRYNARWQTFGGSLFVRVNNLWDVEYRAIENRRMPGRSFQAGVRFDFKQR
jgi:iron complex outermembrane receptor protein